MAIVNPGNWHWVGISVYDWSRTWFDEEIPKISAEDGDVSVKITKLIQMSDKKDNDVVVMQKKNTVLAFFDIVLAFGFSATAAEETDISGEISVNDFDQDTREDQLEFGVTVNSKSEESRKRVRDLIRTKIDPRLRAQLAQFVTVVQDKHKKYIQTEIPDKVEEKPAAPKPIEEPTTAPAQPTAAAIVNTTTLTDQEEFRTTAEELFKTFTDEARLAAFTRARPKTFDGAKKGGKFELFDGNVAGEFLELEEPTKIVQSWRLKQWPAGHYSKQEIEFIQNNDDGVTVMRVTWTGVPLGQEDVTKGNWGEYYVRSIKRTFGFGTIL